MHTQLNQNQNQSQLPEPQPAPQTDTDHRRKGKIAHLPKAVRHQLNLMLEDGVPYKEIRQKLGEHGKFLNKQNISTWRKGGHKAWLKEQQHISIVQARFDHITDLLATTNPNKLPADLLALASIRLAEFLAQLDSADLLNSAQSDPKILARFLSILPRIARESLNQRKYNETGAPAQLEPKDLNRELVQRENDAILRSLDHALGIKGPIRFVTPGTAKEHPDAVSLSRGRGTKGEGESTVPQGDLTPHSELRTPHSESQSEPSVPSTPHSELHTPHSESESPPTNHDS